MPQNEANVVLREQLYEFSQQCEKKLRKNDHKTDWKLLPVEALLRKLEIELEELKVAIQYESSVEAMNECVDVANFALMLWDRLRQPVIASNPFVPKAEAELKREYSAAPPGDFEEERTPFPHLMPSGDFEQVRTPVTHLMPSDDGLAPVKEEPAHAGRWQRHGTWMDGNRAVARMYSCVPPGGGFLIYYEDVPEVRARRLRVVPPYVEAALKEASEHI